MIPYLRHLRKGWELALNIHDCSNDDLHFWNCPQHNARTCLCGDSTRMMLCQPTKNAESHNTSVQKCKKARNLCGERTPIMARTWRGGEAVVYPKLPESEADTTSLPCDSSGEETAHC